MSSFRLVYASHPHWPLPRPCSPSSTSPTRSSPVLTDANAHAEEQAHWTKSPLRVTVLDSSFNPPHAAHLALASTSPLAQSPPDAIVLVLGAANADKGSIAQHELDVRLEMMKAMAQDMESRYRAVAGPGSVKRRLDGRGNVGVVQFTGGPRFVDKSRVIKQELEKRLGAERHMPEVRLSFPLGWDTVVRFFAPKYYGQQPGETYSSAMQAFFETDHSTIVGARRGASDQSDDKKKEGDEEERFLASPEVAPYRNYVGMIDLDQGRVMGVSSTSVREAVKAGQWDRVSELVPMPGVREIIKREKLYL